MLAVILHLKNMILTNFPWTIHWGLQSEKYKTALKAFCLACVYFFPLLSVACVFLVILDFLLLFIYRKKQKGMNNGSWKQKMGCFATLLGMLCSETVGEGVGGSTSACLAIPTYGHKQLSLCQVATLLVNYTHCSLGCMLFHQLV